MATVCTIWLVMSGNGAAIGIVLTTTRLSRTKAALRTIPKVRIRHLILPSLMRKSECIVAALSSATINIAHATLLARVARARSTPAQIISGFDASDRRRKSRNKQRKIRFLTKGDPLIKPDAKQERQLPTRSLGRGPANAGFVLPFGAMLAASRSDSLLSTQTISCPTLGMK